MININCVIDAMLLHKIEHYKYCAWGLAIVIDFYIATTCIYFGGGLEFFSILEINLIMMKILVSKCVLFNQIEYYG